jgi:hypothetical protein
MRLPLLSDKAWSRRVLRPELLETAGLALAERNLHDMARINRWFGPHRTLHRVMKDLVSPQEKFSLLDVVPDLETWAIASSSVSGMRG